MFLQVNCIKTTSEAVCVHVCVYVCACVFPWVGFIETLSQALFVCACVHTNVCMHVSVQTSVHAYECVG